MPRINNRVAPQQQMDFENGGGGGAWGQRGGGVDYSFWGSRVADLPGYGTMWGSFADLGMLEYEGRIENTRDLNAAQAALDSGDTRQAARIPAANPEVGIETGGQRLMGGQAANHLLSQEAQTTTSANRGLAQQPPDLSGRRTPELSQPLGLPTNGRLSPPSPPPPPRTASPSGNNVAARSGFDHARQRQAELQRLPLPPLPPGWTPDPEHASQHGFRQIIDTRSINAQSRDLGRQVARQALLQMGWSQTEAERYIREHPNFTQRADYGRGAVLTDAEMRAQVASGQIDSTMTAEQYRRLEAWRAESIRQTAADDDEVVRIEVSNRQQQARHAGGFGSFVDGLTRGDFSDNDSWSRTGGQIVGGLIPGYGQVADARDTAAAVRDIWQGREGGWGNLALAGVGWVSIVGDSAKGAIRAGRRIVRESAEEAAERAVRESTERIAREAETPEARAALEQAIREGAQSEHAAWGLTIGRRMDELAEQGHGPQRHGSQLTQQQLEDRAVRGHDPVTGTRDDAYNRLPDGSPVPHRYGRHATQLTSEEAYVAAENHIRNSQQCRNAIESAQRENQVSVEVHSIRLEDIFGADYRNQVFGQTRLGSAQNPTGIVDTDFTGGTMRAIYRRDANGNWNLHTMFPEPRQ